MVADQQMEAEAQLRDIEEQGPAAAAHEMDGGLTNTVFQKEPLAHGVPFEVPLPELYQTINYVINRRDKLLSNYIITR